MSAKKPCKAWKTKAQDVSNMTSNSNNEPTFLDMNDLCDDSLEALIQHYLSLKKRMPNNLSVRERLVELQDEKFNREREASTIEGVIRQNTENPL
jgi:hypothetical protein